MSDLSRLLDRLDQAQAGVRSQQAHAQFVTLLLDAYPALAQALRACEALAEELKRQGESGDGSMDYHAGYNAACADAAESIRAALAAGQETT